MERRGLTHRLQLIVITDPAARLGTLPAARAALEAGAPTLQLRCKDRPSREVFELARDLRLLTRSAGALLFVNDRLDVAFAAEADGVHLGDDDIPLAVARRVAPPPFLIGRSVDTPDEAVRAAGEGADYVGAGPVYRTASKSDTGPVMGVPGIAAVCAAVAIPVVGVGGIGTARAAEVVRAGAAGVAVLGAVMFATDPGAATRQLLAALRTDRSG